MLARSAVERILIVWEARPEKCTICKHAITVRYLEHAKQQKEETQSKQEKENIAT